MDRLADSFMIRNLLPGEFYGFDGTDAGAGQGFGDDGAGEQTLLQALGDVVNLVYQLILAGECFLPGVSVYVEDHFLRLPTLLKGWEMRFMNFVIDTL